MSISKQKSFDKLLASYESLEKSVQQLLPSAGGSNDVASLDNIKRRFYYSAMELLRLDIEESLLLLPSSSEANEEKAAVVYKRMDVILKQLKLVPIKRKNSILVRVMDKSLRAVGILCSFMIVGMFFSLSLLILRAIDQFLKRDPFQYWSEYLKRGIVLTMLLQSGIELSVEGLTRDHFESSCALLTFSHASNLDGFMVAGTCPVKQLAFGKKELFMVPFFSWISLAIGGVPVDRGNRDRAVKALKRSTDAAKGEKLCIAIAPEGTRSLSGQLLPFKKGAFYMWDEMQAPILPFVIYGAYDLYPVGSWVNQTGCVTARYLPPILPSQATSRDEMMRLVRRRMLKDMQQCPATIGKDMSSQAYTKSVLLNIAAIAFTAACIFLTRELLVLRCQYSWITVVIGWWIGAVIVTAVLYVYYVYIIALTKRPGADARNSPSANPNYKRD
mmetsp:Transcript_3118/g.4871  ORF Transcript_3118/g.4871 Transcript_3118/m.4871 type:complete len:444 (-) Transcript_3118:114-1445(-)